MSAYVSCGAFSNFITVTIGSVSSDKTPTTACTCHKKRVSTLGLQEFEVQQCFFAAFP